MADSAAERRARQQERRERRAAVTDPGIVLMAASAALLGIRARTTHELRTRLAALGYPTDLIEETIERLGVLGYLDDEAYARAWVASRDRARPRGATALRRELLRQGLGRDLADATLRERDGMSPRAAAEDSAPRRVTEAHTARGCGRPRRRDSACSIDVAARSVASRIRASGGSASTRSWRATASIPGVCMDATRTLPAGTTGRGGAGAGLTPDPSRLGLPSTLDPRPSRIQPPGRSACGARWSI